MKKILLTTLLTSTIAMASNEGLSGFKPGFLNGNNAPQNTQGVPASEEAFAGDWTEEFDTKVGTVFHTPSCVKMGGIQAGTGINMNTPSLNGVALKAPLNLKTNSTREVFVAAMQAAGIL